MSDPSGQSLRIPLPAEIAGGAEKSPASAGRPKRLAARGAAFLCGALAVAGLFQIARSPAYFGGAGLFAALVTGIVAALLARADIPAPVVLRLLSLAAAGGAVTLVSYVVAINAYSPGPLSALLYIHPVDGTNYHVGSRGTAFFSVAVPAHYDKLTISFAVRDDPSSTPTEDCINGSTEDITPTYGASRWPVQDVATGAPDTVQIPRGAATFTLDVQFMPPNNFNHCDEDILVSAAQFSN